MPRTTLKKAPERVILARMESASRDAYKAVSEKKCTGPCGRVKPIDQFNKNPCSSDGRQPKCRECMNAAAAKKRQQVREENIYAYPF